MTENVWCQPKFSFAKVSLFYALCALKCDKIHEGIKRCANTGINVATNQVLRRMSQPVS